jgi:hypothetical protein
VVFTPKSKQNTNSRICSVLNALGLVDRITKEGAGPEQMNEPINYEQAYEKLNPMIKLSKEFLDNALDK